MTKSHTEMDIPSLDSKGLRKYGFTMGIIVAVLFGLFFPWLLNFTIPLWPWIVAGVFFVFAIAFPAALGPVYRIWMKLGILIGRITSPIFMGIVFYLIFTPAALLMKLFAKDPLRRKIDGEAETYRQESKKSPSDRIKRPF